MFFTNNYVEKRRYIQTGGFDLFLGKDKDGIMSPRRNEPSLDQKYRDKPG